MRIAGPLLIALAALPAQAAWLELRHGPFVVYTDAGAEPARLALNHLEQFRYAAHVELVAVFTRAIAKKRRASLLSR